MKNVLIACCLCLLPFMVTGSVDAANYVGSDQCFSCHTDQFNDWQSSGHPWKIRKAEKARYAKLSLPPGYSWDEISYVIGGAQTKKQDLLTWKAISSHRPKMVPKQNPVQYRRRLLGLLSQRREKTL